ncbi:MAG TPA: hypothetical protein VFH47_06250, partial [Candidatus Thermoplasmatota archaeon]|nr:hypothetical protein [Candidatus Thermoplasmatota archaeon]
MRGPAILLLAILAFATAAQAQPPERDFTVRAGFGDIPTVPGDEGAGFHVVQSLRFEQAPNETFEATFHLPAGRLADTGCTCPQFEVQQD